MSIGTRLREARESLGLSLEDAYARTGVGVSSLSEFENGRREPKISQLAELAQSYHRSLTYFLGEGESDPQVLWRERPIEGVAESVEKRFLKLCQQYRHLETWCQDTIEPRLPGVSAGRKPLEYGDAEDLARRVRQELNLGECPALVLLKRLEKDCGIKVFHDTFLPTGTAACVRSERFGMAILLNAGNTPQRRNFDLAHELFHLLTWELYRSGEETSSRVADEGEAKLANAFASALLLPTEALHKAVGRHLSEEGKLPVALLPEIAQEFDVSLEALVWGIHRVYNFGKARKEETERTIAAVREIEETLNRTAERRPDPARYPERYRTLAVRALLNGEMSVGKFAEYMEVSRGEAMRYLRTEGEALGQIQVTAG